MSNFNEERRKMRFEQVERMLNSDITITEWCKLNKVARSTMLEDGHLELSNNIVEQALQLSVESSPQRTDKAESVSDKSSVASDKQSPSEDERPAAETQVLQFIGARRWQAPRTPS